MNNNVNNRKDGDKKKNGKFLLIYVVVINFNPCCL